MYKDPKKRLTVPQILQHDFLILHDIRETTIGQFNFDEISMIFKNLSENCDIFIGLNIEFFILYLWLFFED